MKTKLINSFASLAVLVGLAGCGGGGGGEGSPQIVNENIAISVPTEIQGVYAGKMGSEDFVSLVALTADASKVNWYGLTVQELGSGALKSGLYTGQLSLGSDGLANPISLKAFLGDVLVSLSGSITGASLNAYRGSLTFPSTDAPVLLTADAKKLPVFSASQSANLSVLDGDWHGDWIDKSESSSGKLLRFSATTGKQVLSTPLGFIRCTLNSESTASAAGRGNFFIVSLKFNHHADQICTRAGQTLSGVAFVYHPTPSTSRLELIALDSEGRGISFRADR